MTGQQAIELIAKMTGIPLVTLGLITRALREGNNGLWPQSRRGGGRGASHVEAPHLAALLLAIGQNAVTGANEAVTALGLLEHEKVQETDFTGIAPDLLDAARDLEKLIRNHNLITGLAKIIELVSSKSLLNDNAHGLKLVTSVYKRPDLGYFVGFEVVTFKHDKRPLQAWAVANFQDGYVRGEGFTKAVKTRMLQVRAPMTEIRRFDTSFMIMLGLCLTHSEKRAQLPNPSTGSSSLPDVDGPEVEAPALPGARASNADQFGSDRHPTTYPTAFETRRDGMSSGGTKARPEGNSLRSNPRRNQSHERDPRERACA